MQKGSFTSLLRDFHFLWCGVCDKMGTVGTRIFFDATVVGGGAVLCESYRREGRAAQLEKRTPKKK